MIEIGTKLNATEVIPVAGKYKCIICGLIVDIDQHFIERGSTFFACPICHAGNENGPKGPQDDVWEYLG
ncbi:MAG: hypothetical protein PHS49_04775 [Candidatus Gracilibacteria bacterium]|nr:hypothetical protein [Candidatus Gracilibacteria bacterium]